MGTTYRECLELEASYTNHSIPGRCVDGEQIASWLVTYQPTSLGHTLKDRVRALIERDGEYQPSYEWQAWYPLAKIGNAMSSRGPGCSQGGVAMGAFYLERRYRREVFKLAGLEMPAHLLEGLPEVEE